MKSMKLVVLLIVAFFFFIGDILLAKPFMINHHEKYVLVYMPTMKKAVSIFVRR
ncbi:hypothetical protein [Radiobacillus deserti]|uniref:hypothetical protein n=1 Tax=Radiobacillus deserti TaxID=2594883 RepID=UPI001E38A4F2|nr:hypothetical protein [Radiobacillus deserti]